MTWAIEVFALPGGPQRMQEESESASIARRGGASGPTRWTNPTISLRMRGRIRAANGAARSTSDASSNMPRMPKSERGRVRAMGQDGPRGKSGKRRGPLSRVTQAARGPIGISRRRRSIREALGRERGAAIHWGSWIGLRIGARRLTDGAAVEPGLNGLPISSGIVPPGRWRSVSIKV